MKTRVRATLYRTGPGPAYVISAIIDGPDWLAQARERWPTAATYEGTPVCPTCLRDASAHGGGDIAVWCGETRFEEKMKTPDEIPLPSPQNYAAALRVFVPVLRLMGHAEALALFEAIATELDEARWGVDAEDGETIAQALERQRDA